MFRASSMSRVLACPYSETIKHERDESSDAAKWGQEVHKWMETRGAYTPKDIGIETPDGFDGYEWAKKVKHCKNLNEVAAEAFGWRDYRMQYEVNVAMGYDNAGSLVPCICKNASPAQWAEYRSGKLLSGTIDMLTYDWDAGVVIIRDLKTGTIAPEVENNKQLLAYAACLPIPNGLSVSLEILHWPYKPYKGLPTLTKWQVERETIDAFVGEVKAAKNDIEVNRWALSPNVGEHCAFCPGKKNCEGWK